MVSCGFGLSGEKACRLSEELSARMQVGWLAGYSIFSEKESECRTGRTDGAMLSDRYSLAGGSARTLRESFGRWIGKARRHLGHFSTKPCA